MCGHTVYKLEYTDTIKYIKPKINLKALGNAQDLVDVSKTKLETTYDRILPASMDLDLYGGQLQVAENKEGESCVEFNNKSLTLRTLYKDIKPDFVADSDIQLFSKDGRYLVSVRSNTVGRGAGAQQPQHNIDVFAGDGSHILPLVDTGLTDTTFTRTAGNVTKTIDVRGRMINTLVNVRLEAIKRPAVPYAHRNLVIPDPRIGTLDLETYTVNGIARVYSLGFYTQRLGKAEMSTFYINPSLDSNELVLRCIDAMLVEKYKGITFYVHNLGEYDIVFLLRILAQANTEARMAQGADKYKLEQFAKDGVILYLTIKKVANVRVYIKLVDSYNILTHSLRDLGKTFELDVQKDVFPYSFVDENTISYRGSKPDKSYYPEGVDQPTYDLIPREDWNTQIETLKYLEIDLKSLFEVMSKFSDNIYRNHKVQVSGSLTISSLAMKIFLSRFYDAANAPIPLINRKSIADDIRKSYFGGITEVYKPYGEALYYYDVNSLYPYAALNPMPGLACIFNDSINAPISHPKHLY